MVGARAETGNGSVPTMAQVRARARCQRWEDNSDLVSVALVAPEPRGSEGPQGLTGNAPLSAPRRHVSTFGPRGQLVDGGGPVPLPTVLKAPTGRETAIEVPYRLVLSPNIHTVWAHRATPAAGAWVELWHTRLATRAHPGVPPVEDDHPMRTVRAIWARDTGFSPVPDAAAREALANASAPFRTSLGAAERYEIADLSSGSGAVPIEVDRFILTSLGAWLECRGQWDPPDNFTLEERRYRGTMGREHFVRVVAKGCLFPFGHRASLVEITERKLQNVGNTVDRYAILRQRMHLIVRRPLLTYGPPMVSDADVRRFPFRSVRITTLATPDLDKAVPIGGHEGVFWRRSAPGSSASG